MFFEWWHFVWIPIVVIAPLVFTFWVRRKVAAIGQPAFAPVAFQPLPMAPLPPQPPPAPTHIKQTPCRNCGAVKVHPPRTACLYCDFCGTLVDWDLRMALSTSALQPMRELARLNYLETSLRGQAVAAGNREAYRQSAERVWLQHTASCPSVYSPRIWDADYRQRLVHYLSLVDTEIAFDPLMQQLEHTVASTRRMLPAAPGLPVHPATLNQLVTAKKASLERAVALIAPHIHLHPDEATSDLARAVMASTFVQNWLPYLDAATQQWLITEMGLDGEYAPITASNATTRHCGRCAQSVMCVPGATRVLCEACGHFNDVSRPEAQCGECGAAASIPHGAHAFACPFCRADMRVG